MNERTRRAVTGKYHNLHTFYRAFETLPLNVTSLNPRPLDEQCTGRVQQPEVIKIVGFSGHDGTQRFIGLLRNNPDNSAVILPFQKPIRSK